MQSEIDRIKHDAWNSIRQQYNDIKEAYESWDDAFRDESGSYDPSAVDGPAGVAADAEADAIIAEDAILGAADLVPIIAPEEEFPLASLESPNIPFNPLRYRSNFGPDLYYTESDTQDPLSGSELRTALNRIEAALTTRNPSGIKEHFEYARWLCTELAITIELDSDEIEDATRTVARLATVSTGRVIFAPPKPTLWVPELIIPIQAQLLALIQKDPALVFNITPRQFEEIIAELFDAKGFSIELTKQTRDGGRDIIAIHETMNTRLKLLIECKRWAPANKVSLSVVQRLYGVKTAEAASKAILVTTSSFSAPARQFASDHFWELDLKGYNDIMKWIREYTYPTLGH